MKNLQILFLKKRITIIFTAKVITEMKENVSVVFVLFGFKAFQNGY